MTIFSAALACKMGALTNAHYWKKNVISLVMFDQVVQI